MPVGKDVARFVISRFAGLVATLLVTSFVVFGALYLTPGGQLGYLLGGRSATPDQIRQVRQQYHLDQPFWSRFFSYLSDLLHGRLGQSLVFKEGVSGLLAPRIINTVLLVAYASVLIVLVGIALGTLAGLRGGVV